MREEVTFSRSYFKIVFFADEWIRKLWYYIPWNIIQPLKRIHLNQF